jgi:hypothetical protein
MHIMYDKRMNRKKTKGDIKYENLLKLYQQQLVKTALLQQELAQTYPQVKQNHLKTVV